MKRLFTQYARDPIDKVFCFQSVFDRFMSFPATKLCYIWNFKCVMKYKFVLRLCKIVVFLDFGQIVLYNYSPMEVVTLFVLLTQLCLLKKMQNNIV